MRNKGSTFSYLTLPTEFARAALSLQSAFLPPRPVEVESFGTNPGNLKMFLYAPRRLAPGRPLVVLLHGCGQSATSFASDAGWMALADQHRLALLMPEQLSANNRMRCFNWFRQQDVRRNSGEAMSIRQMVRKAVATHDCDPSRIFIAGFSAGAAMTAALLAAYPALFAAGGIFAGMPVGCAHSAAAAMVRMRHPGTDATRERRAGEALRATRPGRRWPRVSIWQGGRDHTVAPGNARDLAEQWSAIQGFGPAETATLEMPHFRRVSWGRSNRPPAVELWTLPAIGHAFPIYPKSDGRGRTGTYVADAGVSGTQMLAEFWGLKPPKA